MKAKLSDNYGGEEMECAPCAPPKGQVCEDCEQKQQVPLVRRVRAEACTDKLCEICHNDVTDERGSAYTFTTDQVAVEAARLAAARQARGGARLVLPPQDPAVVTQEALAQQAIDQLEAQLAAAKEKLLHAQAQRMRASSE